MDSDAREAAARADAAAEPSTEGRAPEVVPSHVDYLPSIFKRCMAAVVASRGAHSEPAALDYIVMLAESYMQTLYSDLAAVAHMQRRAQPCLEDLALLLAEQSINAYELEQEKALDTVYTRQLANLAFDPELEDLTPAATPFFVAGDKDLHNILPPSREPPSYIPSWMPALPADHTYMASAEYSNQVRDLRTLRERLVGEGKLAEQALQRLLGQGGSESCIQVADVADGERQRLAPVRVEMPTAESVDHVEAAAKAQEEEALASTMFDGSDLLAAERPAALAEPTEAMDTEPALTPAPAETPAAQAEPAVETAIETATETAETAAPEPAVETAPAHAEDLEEDEPGPGYITVVDEPTQSLASATLSQLSSAAVTDRELTPAEPKPETKLKLNLGFMKKPEKQPLKLKIALGKKPKKKTEHPFGKRPKLDIAELAQKHSNGEEAGPFKPWDRPAKPDAATMLDQPLAAQLAQALQAISR